MASFQDIGIHEMQQVEGGWHSCIPLFIVMPPIFGM